MNNERLYIRVCPEDKELIKYYAELTNMNISSFIKFCITYWITEGNKDND